MGRYKKAFKDDISASAAGNKSIKQFFKVKQPPPAPKRVGRPKKKQVGRPPTAVEVAEEIEHALTAADDDPVKLNDEVPSVTPENEEGSAPPSSARSITTKEITTRLNWGKSPHRKMLMEALDAWNNKEEMKFDENGEEIMDYKIFANRMRIPPPTFYAYIHPDPIKRRKLGQGERGKKKLLLDDEVKFAGEVLARQDRANDGYSSKEANDMILTLNPKVTHYAARRQLERRVLPTNHAAGILKKKSS